MNENEFDEFRMLLGGIALECSLAEGMIDTLIEMYLGEGVDRAVLSELGPTKDRQPLLRKLVESVEEATDLKEAVLSVLEAFKISKQNRNVLLHSSRPSDMAADEYILMRRQNKFDASHPYAGVVVSLKNVRKVEETLKECVTNLALAQIQVGQKRGYKIFSGSIKVHMQPNKMSVPEAFPRAEPDSLNQHISTLRKLNQDET